MRAQLLGHATPGGREVGCDDQGYSLDAQRGDDGDADRAAADHDGGAPFDGAGLVDRVEAHRQRLGQGGVLGIGPGRQGHDATGVDDHPLRVAAGPHVREAEGVGPLGVPHQGMDGDDGAGRQVVDALAAGQHPSGQLVAHHEVGAGVEVEHAQAAALGGGDEAGAMVAAVQVGAADPAGDRLEQHMAGQQRRLGHLVHPQLAAPQHQRSHGRGP